MSDTYDFYRERYNDIQRYAYLFLSQVPLTPKEQGQIIRKYSLGTDFVTINSVQDYNNDWLIKGYVKVDIRDVEEPVSNIKGKFLDTENFLKETMVQLPKILFELDEDALKSRIYKSCMKVAKGRIEECIVSLRMQKTELEKEIEFYLSLLNKYSCEEE